MKECCTTTARETWLDPTELGVVCACGTTIPYEAARLEYLRGELRAERIGTSELHELQGLAEHIDPGDVELLEAAGVPEFQEEAQR
jgi:hypothetical protein